MSRLVTETADELYEMLARRHDSHPETTDGLPSLNVPLFHEESLVALTKVIGDLRARVAELEARQ